MLVTRAVFGGIAACAAGFFAMVLTMLMLSDPSWQSEAIVAGVAAAAWMTAGLRVAGRDASKLGALLFLPGAAVAWFLARGIVHSTSPYYGLSSFAAACLGASVAWAIHGRRTGWGAARVVAVALPVAVLASGLIIALYRAPLGVTRGVSTPALGIRRLPVAPTDSSGRRWYIWSDADVDLITNPDSTVIVELDPGSGAGPMRITETRDPADIGAACAAFRAQTMRTTEAEIARGSTPRFMTSLPVGYPDCERGRVWIIRRD